MALCHMGWMVIGKDKGDDRMNRDGDWNNKNGHEGNTLFQ